MTAPRARLSVVVLTSIPLGIEVAAAVRSLPEVGQLALLTAPAAPGKSVIGLLADTYRYEGVPGILRAALRRLRKAVGLEKGRTMAALAARRCPHVAHFAMAAFHSRACHARIEAMAPDLAIVVGTHILRADVFSIPRRGSINLHLGAAPEFRGSSPGFYEMLEGVAEVGVTIHRVTEALDGGNILLQERFPLDLAPEGDPVKYLRRYVAEVLGPNGVRMMAETVAALAHGTHVEVPQDPNRAQTRRRATYALKRQLRRRVAARRKLWMLVLGGRLTFGANEP